MRLVDEVFPVLEGLYVDLHHNPELSGSEYRTAGIVAEWLSRAGFEVATGVGGTGVVGVLRNGDGPTVLLRGDMDGLPVEEHTGLEYASAAHTVDDDGEDVPLMHACGHDVHTTCLVGTADLLATARDNWRGTLIVVAQPAEETVSGAAAMLADGLYDRFGRPDVALAQHVGPHPAGLVAHRAGVLLAASARLRVRVFGSGGHGARPDRTVDPVVIAANIVNRLQTVVSRETNPTEMAVVTVGVVRAGTKANIIPDEAYLEITTRAFDDFVNERLHTAIERIVRAEAEASDAPREPEIVRDQEVGVTRNAPETTAALIDAHRAYFGEPHVVDLPEPTTGSEDFGLLGLPDDPEPIPTVMWFLGSTPHDVWDKAPGDTPFEKLQHVPGPHSTSFAPDREVTLRAGVAALTLGALTYLAREDTTAAVLPPPHVELAAYRPPEPEPVDLDEEPVPEPVAGPEPGSEPMPEPGFGPESMAEPAHAAPTPFDHEPDADLESDEPAPPGESPFGPPPPQGPPVTAPPPGGPPPPSGPPATGPPPGGSAPTAAQPAVPPLGGLPPIPPLSDPNPVVPSGQESDYRHDPPYQL